MILAVEIEHEGWIHEECNAGMLNLLRQSSSEELYFAAAKSQIEAVKNVGVPDNLQYITISVPARSINDDMSYVDIYTSILADMIEKLQLSSKDKVVYLSATTVIMKAAILVNQKYHAQMFFVVHNYLEEILQNTDVGKQYQEMVSEVCARDDCRIIVFHPYARKTLAGIIKGNLEKIEFLHIPMKEIPVIPKHKQDKIIIGVYGNSINSNFYKILKRLADADSLKKIEFLVLRRTKIYNFDVTYHFPPYGVRLFQSDGFDRKFRMERMQEMDYILLAYDFSMYQLYMSGILADAIQHEKPIVAMNTSILQYYNQAPIGIVEDTMEHLSDRISCIDRSSEEEMQRYRHNLRNLKKRMFAENIEIMKRLLDS